MRARMSAGLPAPWITVVLSFSITTFLALPRSVIDAFSRDRKSTRLNSSHDQISYAVFCLKKKKRVCVTRGPQGCVLLIGDEYIESNGYAVEAVDTVGAGDAFATDFVHGLGSRWSPPEDSD